MTRGRLGGWQKPVAPPTGKRPKGLPPKPPIRIVGRAKVLSTCPYGWRCEGGAACWCIGESTSRGLW